MVGFEKALEAVKVIKDQIQYRSQSLPVGTLEFNSSTGAQRLPPKLFYYVNPCILQNTGGKSNISILQDI